TDGSWIHRRSGTYPSTQTIHPRLESRGRKGGAGRPTGHRIVCQTLTSWRSAMKLIGLISPNLSEDTLVDVYKILPEGIRIEGRALNVGKYTDDEFNRAELAFSDLVRDLARRPLDFLMVTGELFLSYKGPGSDRQILSLVKQIPPTPASTAHGGYPRMSSTGAQASGDGDTIPRRPGRAAGSLSRSRRHRGCGISRSGLSEFRGNLGAS